MKNTTINQPQPDPCVLFLSNAKGIYPFEPDQIVRLKALDNYTLIYPVNHQPFVASKVLKIFQSLLEPYGFIRTHRSHLVNTHFIRRVDAGVVTMQDDSTAEISRRREHGVMKLIKSGAKRYMHYSPQLN